jgi:acyl-coenzyme A thioesterase PaaI-like protein
MDLVRFFEASRKSSFGMKKLNFILHRMIPFNKPHKLKVVQLSPVKTIVSIPFRKSNLNHLKGLHACALATAAEYCSGLVLLQYLNPKEYRLIMESLEVTYHYQAKMGAEAHFGIEKKEVERDVIQPLSTESAVFYKCQIEVHDVAQNHICTVNTNWQIKSWDKVRMK